MHFNANNISWSEKWKRRQIEGEVIDDYTKKKKTFYVASFFVCLSTHFLRATNLMSDNVTLQNTSLWFSMIVLCCPLYVSEAAMMSS